MQQAITYKPSWLLPPPVLYTTTSTNNNNNTSPNNNHHKETTKERLIKGSSSTKTTTNMQNMVSENAVIVFSRKGCCMGHVVKRLLLCLGVNPAVYEVDEEDEVGVLDELEMINNKHIKVEKGDDHIKKVQFPSVFIGGRLFGGLDRVMATHISGELVPVLKEAGALWL